MRGNKISRVDYNPSAKNGSEADASPAMPLVTLGVLIWSDWILVTNVELCPGKLALACTDAFLSCGLGHHDHGGDFPTFLWLQQIANLSESQKLLITTIEFGCVVHL